MPLYYSTWQWCYCVDKHMSYITVVRRWYSASYVLLTVIGINIFVRIKHYTLLCCLFPQQFHTESVSSRSCCAWTQTRCSLLFHPAVDLALVPVSFSPVKMWDPGHRGLQSHSDQCCYIHVMFSNGSWVWVRHLAGQINKQRYNLNCYDMVCAEAKIISFFVFMLVCAVSNMPWFITAPVQCRGLTL